MALLTCLNKNSEEWQSKRRKIINELEEEGMSIKESEKRADKILMLKFERESLRAPIQLVLLTNNSKRENKLNKGKFNEENLLRAVLEKIASRLNSKFNTTIKIINQLLQAWKSKISNGIVFINSAKANVNSLLHSFGYLFLEVIKNKNKELYDNILNEGVKTLENDFSRLYSTLKFQYKKENYTEQEIVNDENFKREAALIILSLKVSNNIDVKTGDFSFKSFEEISKKILYNELKEGESFKVEDLKLSLTLEDLADILLNENLYFEYETKTLKEEAQFLKVSEILKTMKGRYIDFLRSPTAFRYLKGRSDTVSKDDEDVKEFLKFLQGASESEQLLSIAQKAFQHLSSAKVQFYTRKTKKDNIDISYKKKFEDLLQKENLTQEELNSFNEDLNEMKHYLQLYSNIEDLKNILNELEVRDLFTEFEIKEINDSVDNVIKLTAGLSKDIKYYMLKLSAKWLFTYQKNHNVEGSKSNKSEDDIYKELLQANKDISLGSFLFSALINNTDLITNLTSLALKDREAEVNKKSVNLSFKLKQLLKDNKIKTFFSKEEDIENYFKNRFISRKTSVDYVRNKDNEYERTETEFWAFEQEFNYEDLHNDIVDYNNKLRNNTSLTEKAKKELRDSYRQSLYKQNDESKNFLKLANDYFLGKVNADVFQKEFKKYTLYSVLLERNIGIDLYKQGLAIRIKNAKGNLEYYKLNNRNFTLIDSYKNLKFEKIKDDKLYKELFNAYTEANDKLLWKQKLKYGRILSVNKKEELIDVLKDKYKEVLDKIKNGEELNEEEQEVYDKLNNLDGTRSKQLLIRYISKQTDDVNLNLLDNIFTFYHSSIKYDEFSKIEGNIQTLISLVQGDSVLGQGRTALETDENGKNILTKFSKTFLVKDGESRANTVLLKMIESNFYQIENWEDKVWNVLIIGKISAKKTDKFIKFWTALTSMGLRLDLGVTNLLFGQQQIWKEATSKGYYTLEDYKYAGKIASKYSSNYDITEEEKKLLEMLVMRYGALQGDFISELNSEFKGFSVKDSVLSKAFIFQSSGEMNIAITEMLSIFKANNIDFTKDYKIDNNGDLISSSVNNDLESEMRNKIQFMSKMHHGIYSKQDEPMMKKYLFFDHFMMFRNHIYNAFKYRYMSERYDYQLKDTVKGYYREIWDLYKEKSMSLFIKQMISKEGLNEKQLQAYRKVMFDIAWLITIQLAVLALSALEDDDDEEGLVLDHLLLLFVKLKKDAYGYLPLANILDTLKLIQSLALTFRTISKFGEFGQQLFSLFDMYEQKYGYFDKGDNKLLAKMMKLTLFMSSFISLNTLEEQRKYYGIFFAGD